MRKFIAWAMLIAGALLFKSAFHLGFDKELVIGLWAAGFAMLVDIAAER